eukprot:2495496-Lingulodinium_polyedra.AAC.1
MNPHACIPRHAFAIWSACTHSTLGSTVAAMAALAQSSNTLSCYGCFGSKQQHPRQQHCCCSDCGHSPSHL